MMRAVVMVVLLSVCLQTMCAASFCDKRIIKKMRQKFWNNGRCIPRDLMRNGVYMSPGSVIRATKDFYPNEETLSCVYAEYCGSSISFTAQFNDNSNGSQISTISKDIPVYEKDGVLYETGQGIYLYHLYSNRFGVTAFYKCNITGEYGDPEGIIKVSSRGFDQQAVAEAVQDLACLGIYVSNKVYSVSCAQ